ncbi:hypothetical protein GQ53DRAFT_628996, partial [Thozetella sp. PMI_491]
MDAATIRNCIVGTLDADTDTRRRAELQLKQAEEHAGFTDILLEILQSEQDVNLQLSS